MEKEELKKAISGSRRLREHLLRDEHRPGYHFAVPESRGMPGDPNGAFYARGRYHLMYLYNRAEPGQKDAFCYGHISSADLVHWRHHPDSIGPGGVDGGCFSGGAFVDDDEAVYMTYWALPGGEGEPGGIAIARSSDRYYENWEKTVIIPGSKFGIADEAGEPVGNADPSNIWKQDGVYYLQTGNLLVLNKYGRAEDTPQRFRGDWADLYRSKDLTSWEYAGRFYSRRAGEEWTRESEDCMCPSFLPLPLSPDGSEPSDKHLQLFISHNMGCQYYIGAYDPVKERFLPERHGRMTWADRTFFAPEALMDGRGRQIMWAWLVDNPHPEWHEESEKTGWSGVFGLPRVLWLGGNGSLCMAPADELKTLRCTEYNIAPFTVRGGDELVPVEGCDGRSCELELVIRPVPGGHAGVRVRTSADGRETTLIYYDDRQKALCFDARISDSAFTRDDFNRPIEKAPFELAEDEPLRLRVFVDRSVVEVFANDRQAVTRRVFPSLPDSEGIALYGSPGTAFIKVTVWDMMPSNMY